TGKGIIIGVLDAGFTNTDELPVFDSLWDNGQILGTRDFVDGGEITFNKHFHGTMVLSTMGGNYPGEIVGTAPDAYYYLLRTEDGSSELIIEEYNWVSGAEYADSLGADVLNTSLGYSDFPDDPSQNHTYEDMDGNTTPITIGADIAASRGMIVVNSAGNSGSSAWYYITAPADGDSVFTIGAVNSQGVPASFTSHGPTYDGRIKPNVSAQGEGAYVARPDGTFIYGNGTSFSSPITAGMMACLWQANTDMSNMDLINAVQASGSRAENPDSTIGYGIPDFMAAHNILTVIENDDEIVFTRVKLFPNPFTSNFVLNVSSEVNAGARMIIVDMTGRTVFENDYLISQGMNSIRVTALDNIPAGIYFLRLKSGSSVITTKLIRQ
ncbi:MAG: S8 family serine peptidase, partial [Bacteroidales bacterium]|nr:S8 family serine peptidase [Bacteroidales bacterium]